MRPLRGEIAPGPGDFFSCEPCVVAAVRIIETVGQNAATVDPFPTVEVVRKRISFVPCQLVCEKIGYPGGEQELRKVTGKSKRIRKPCYFCALPEPAFEIFLAKKKLANPRFAGRKIAVRLDPHSSHDFPGAFANPGADLLEEQGIAFFDPGIELCA
jgi:hypothetical protein